MAFQRGHSKQESSFGGGSWGSVPALTFQEAVVTHLRFVGSSSRPPPQPRALLSCSLAPLALVQIQQGFLDALKFQGVGEKLVMDRVSRQRCDERLGFSSQPGSLPALTWLSHAAQVVQANVVKSTLLQGVILISALAVKPLLRATHNDYSSASTTASIFYWLFHVRTKSLLAALPSQLTPQACLAGPVALAPRNCRDLLLGLAAAITGDG